METIVKSNTIKDKLIAEFESSRDSLFGDVKLRDKALEAFAKQGIPGRKSEEYKYVNMELALKGDFKFSSSKKLSTQQIESTQFLKEAIIVVIENGIFSSEHSKINSLPKGLQIINIIDATSNVIFQKHYSKYADINSDAFIALNTALYCAL